MNVRVSWQAQASDWDIKLYEDSNGDGKSSGRDHGRRHQPDRPEQRRGGLRPGHPAPDAGQAVRAAREQLRRGRELLPVDITFAAPPPFKPAQVESYTLTCEQGGRVFDTQQVQIDRGQVKQLDLSACTRAIAAAGGAQPISAPGQGTPPACASAAILRSVKASAAGRGVRFAFSKRSRRGSTSTSSRSPCGRKVIGERLVARFRGKTQLVHLERARPSASGCSRASSSPATRSGCPTASATSAARCCASRAGASRRGPTSTAATPAGCCAPTSSSAPRSAAARSGRCASPSASPARRTCGSRCCAATGQDARAVASASRPAARTARACAPRGCARATTGCRSGSAAPAARPRRRR